MEHGKSFAPQPVVAARLNCGALKTWSVIVTILGDLAAAPGARVPGPVLSALTEGMGLKPEAEEFPIPIIGRRGVKNAKSFEVGGGQGNVAESFGLSPHKPHDPSIRAICADCLHPHRLVEQGTGKNLTGLYGTIIQLECTPVHLRSEFYFGSLRTSPAGSFSNKRAYSTSGTGLFLLFLKTEHLFCQPPLTSSTG